jgi:hypothetical protein
MVIIYPNPAKNNFYLEIDALLQPLSFDLYSLNGQKMFVEIYQLNPFYVFLIITSLNLSEIYFMRVICEDKVLTNKIIIN